MKIFSKSQWMSAVVLLIVGVQTAIAQETALRMTWADADHPSGVYHAKESGTFSVVVENLSQEKQVLKGMISFGIRTGADGFKAISVTPVTATEIGTGERAKIPMAVTFAGTGSYECRWIDGDVAEKAARGAAIENTNAVTMECIFAPRDAKGGPNGDGRWLTALPRQAATVPGYLPDLMKQTGVRKYLLDERFAFDAATGVTLALGASLGVSSERIDALFADAARAKAEIVLRVTVPMRGGPGGERVVEAFHQYMVDAMRRGHNSIAAIVIVPEKEDMTDTDRAAFRAFYLAGYSAAKAADKNILLLGAGTAALTRTLLLNPRGTDSLNDYIDAIAVTDTSAQPAAIQQISKLPVWVLPPRVAEPWALVPAAVGLAEGAAVVTVPPPAVDRGVIEHLLGGTVLYQKLHRQPGALPYAASFQGDGYAVAAIAGLAAGTPLDAAWPPLAHTQTVVTPLKEDEKPAYPNLEVGDDSATMRVVDSAGAPVDCRQGDTLYVPAADKVVYVLQGGSADDLLSTLTSAVTNRLPVMELEATAADEGNSVILQITNISTAKIAGVLRLIVPGEKEPTVLGEQHFLPLDAGKSTQIHIELNAPLAKEQPVIAEIVTDGTAPVTQRTALKILHPRTSIQDAVPSPLTSH